MKTGKLRNVLVVTSLALGSLLIFSSCDKDDDDTPNRVYTVNGSANGTYNPDTKVFNYTSNWNGLTGVPTNGGFYSGDAGANGTLVGTTWTFPVGSTATGSSTGSMTSTAEQATQLISGGWYYSYGTAVNPAGEVRGQITATQTP